MMPSPMIIWSMCNTDKDKVNSEGYTPLYLASCHGYIKLVQYLVERGTSLDKANDDDKASCLCS